MLFSLPIFGPLPFPPSPIRLIASHLLHCVGLSPPPSILLHHTYRLLGRHPRLGPCLLLLCLLGRACPPHGPPTSTAPGLETSSPLPSVVHPAGPPPLLRSHRMTTRAQSGIYRPKRLFQANLTTRTPPPLEPHSVKEAMQYSEWDAALRKEHSTLLRNHTWDLVPRQPHFNVLGSKWVYRIKPHSDGSINLFKCRLVAKGFLQHPSVDF
ncbi:unnamed protein product [Linum trigynum]|uniref:Reverse transcriptase Ty1/copia-type domain-containing protein n=1 Tax=Linum trigynum TaxID=586398 RepID=A0AAV2E9U4_9ROSI